MMENHMPSVDSDVSGSESLENTHQQYVTFRLLKECFGLPMDRVLEIIRLPETVKVPLTPSALLGLANLRGGILPIFDLRQVLGFECQVENESTRIVIVQVGSPVGFVVDRIERVIEAESHDIAPAASLSAAVASQFLQGVLKASGNNPLIQLIDVDQIVSHNFSDLIATHHVFNDIHANVSQEAPSRDVGPDVESKQLVSFLVNGQEYAFDLADVQEIVRVPDEIAKVPKTGEHVIGLIHLRGHFLPLVSLRQLFKMDWDSLTEQNRIVVVNVSQRQDQLNCIGLVVDQVREVLRVEDASRDDVPALLNLGGESDEISSVCRLENGKRLVSVLRASALVTHPEVQAALDEKQAQQGEIHVNQDQQLTEVDDDTVQLVIFQLNGQEYGVSIEYVQEITRLPEKLDKVPRTPDFVEGMANLRGTVLPVMDMRSRFDLEKMPANDRQRIVVLNIDGTRTGFIVDLVSEVLRIPKSKIERSPSLSDDQARVMGEVVNLRDAKRMIQVLSVNELLNEQQITAIASGAVA